ncbi:phage portal protein [Mycolicibacter heraklionensis]|uniref:phage portal protein n=1 Tax=Mycolicibacter heraklionensis TaxID=512402 RepID=UPI000A486B25|nr:phage portal protein [Mycolicibacter heraklionensis]
MADLTPQEWFDALNARFTAITRPKWQDKRAHSSEHSLVSRERRPRNEILDTLWSYRVGDPPLPYIEPEYHEAFCEVLRLARVNLAPMCVKAMLDRMELQAVSTAIDNDTDGDDLAAEIMEESGFGAMSKEFFDYAFSMGESYAMSVPGDPVPTLHAIDPRRCVGVRDTSNPVRLAAALLKEYDQITKEETAYLFLPGQKWTFRKGGDAWAHDPEFEAVQNLDDLGGIPIVRFDNEFGLGEYEPHIDLLDRIIDTTLKRIIGFAYQALRQRALRGDEAEDDEDSDTPEGGGSSLNPDDFRAGPGALWRIPKDFDIVEFAQANFNDMLVAKRDDIKEFAASSQTALHWIIPDAADGSAEGAGLMRESSTAKLRDRRVRATPTLRLLWRIAFAQAGQDRGRKITLHWGPIELRTLAERASASAQAVGTLSLGQRCQRLWDMSPEEIEENIQQLVAERLLMPDAPFAPTAPAAAAPPVDDSGDDHADQPS